jgi:hypothetical protein
MWWSLKQTPSLFFGREFVVLQLQWQLKDAFEFHAFAPFEAIPCL